MTFASAAPRATWLRPCVMSSAAPASVRAAKALSQSANESASALTNSALPAFFSLSVPWFGLATPCAAAQVLNWLLAAWPINWPNVRTPSVGWNV